MTRVVLDDRVRRYEGGRVLVGGAGRMLRLTDAGAAALDAPPAALARRLIDAGLAHPLPAPVTNPDATIVIPVRDRPEELDRCLGALGAAGEDRAFGRGDGVVGAGGEDRAFGRGDGVVGAGGDRAVGVGRDRGVGAGGVIVVDDGSDAPAAIAEVCRRHGARVIRRAVPGGPAAARNEAIAHVGTELVAFLDSDCVAPPDWVRDLVGHFDDPRVAAVAPRVRDPALDMGASPAEVAPGARVSYVPSAALIVRRAALGGFDEALRYGEDVDLVWRLHDRGWRVRYDPRVEVAHARPERRRARAGSSTALDRDLAVRRFRYGTSAAPLALRHPGRLAPFVLTPGPAAVLILLAVRKPKTAAILLAGQTALLATRLHRLGMPKRLAPALTVKAVAATAKGIVGGHPAYRAGVIAGAIRYRTAAPLIPQLKRARPAAIRNAPRR